MTHDLGAYALHMVEFVGVHAAWAAPLAFVLAFAEFPRLSFAVGTRLGLGALIGAGNLKLLADLDCRRARGRLGRLAVVLARN
jgi:hypothetical protein